jgi:hypothetical protein
MLVLIVSIMLSKAQKLSVFKKGMTYFCRVCIFAVKITQKYLLFDPFKKDPYSVCPNYAFRNSKDIVQSMKASVEFHLPISLLKPYRPCTNVLDAIVIDFSPVIEGASSWYPIERVFSHLLYIFITKQNRVGLRQSPSWTPTNFCRRELNPVGPLAIVKKSICVLPCASMSLSTRLGCRRWRYNPTTCNVCHVDNAYCWRRRHTHSCYRCRQRLPLASTTHPLTLQYVASAYHWRHRHTTHPCYALLHFSVDCRLLASQDPAKNMHKAHTNTIWYAHGEWRRRTDNIQAQALSAMQAQGPFASVLKAPLSSLDATYKKVQMAPFPPHCQCKRN